MNKRILAVDDSPSVRKLVEFSLKAKGYLVSTAENGQEALEMLQQVKFDGIILDINMPRMDGFEFLRMVRGDGRLAAIPVLMLTTEGQDGDKVKAMNLGATAYLVKPFKPTEILVAIETMLSA
jgi:two-component system chemotaxis response regulator CheY